MNNSSVSNFRKMRLAALTIGFVVLGISHAAHADRWGAQPQTPSSGSADYRNGSDIDSDNATAARDYRNGSDIDSDNAAAARDRSNPSSANYENEMDRASDAAAAAGGGATCKDESETARAACLFPGVSGMDSGESMVYTMMMNQLVSTAAQIASVGKNMSQQCKLQADVSKVMGTINGVKGAACMKMISSCGTTCTNEANKHRQTATDHSTKNQGGQFTDLIADENKSAARKSGMASTCKAYSTQVVGMMMGAMQNLGNFAANKQCQNDLAAFAANAPPVATLPPFPVVGDCSDPNNQTLGCFCTKAGNATTAMCAGFNGGSLAGGGTTTTPNGSTVASPVGGTIADATDGNTVDPFAVPKKDAAGGSKEMGDGGSGAPGGGGLSALSSEGGGSAAYGDPRSAITGTSGGNGGGLGGSGGGGGGGGGLARNNGAGGNGVFDKFNLKRFLPGSKYKTRGIAGMSVKSVDGITGPMGPTLFEKATRQYQEQIQKQNVILDK